MQTFMPYPCFKKTFSVLDYRRLGKQRVEARQIYDTLTKSSTNGWKNHPAVLMWKGYENALAQYHNLCITEWINRGFNNNMKFLNVSYPVKYPPFVGNELFHTSHKSNLIRKNPMYYRRFFGYDIPDNIKYVWLIDERDKI